jgi:Ca2+/Na+ antiporter
MFLEEELFSIFLVILLLFLFALNFVYSFSYFVLVATTVVVIYFSWFCGKKRREMDDEE